MEFPVFGLYSWPSVQFIQNPLVLSQAEQASLSVQLTQEPKPPSEKVLLGHSLHDPSAVSYH